MASPATAEYSGRNCSAIAIYALVVTGIVDTSPHLTRHQGTVTELTPRHAALRQNVKIAGAHPPNQDMSA